MQESTENQQDAQEVGQTDQSQHGAPASEVQSESSESSAAASTDQGEGDEEGANGTDEE